MKVAELGEEFGHYENFRAFVGDVRDRDRMTDACRVIDEVVCAAALKRVDTTCYNPDELMKPNVIGVMNTIRAAADNGVKRVLLISSDKATNPTNSYGISKAMAESIATSANIWAHPRGTSIASVRYGNVAMSTGSVVTIWRKQIQRGSAPLTVTDARMTRFMMRVETAVQLILDALEQMQGGEIFVPILPSAYMTDLAKAVAPDRAQVFTGLRPGGEKLAEALLNEEEPSSTRRVGPYYVVAPSHHEWIREPQWPGELVDPRLVYRSDTAERYLTPSELAELLASTSA